MDTELVTGVVYSVPAHAPYDYMGLVDVQEERVKAPPQVVRLARALKPISIISVKGYSDLPAEDEVRKRGIRDSNDPKLEDATAEVYKAEFHRGVMKENCDGFKGLKVSDAKPKVVEEMTRRRALSTPCRSSRRRWCASAAPGATSRRSRTSGF